MFKDETRNIESAASRLQLMAGAHEWESCSCALCLAVRRLLGVLYHPEASGAVQGLGVTRLRTVHAELLDLAEGGTGAATSVTPGGGERELPGEGVSKKKEKKEKNASKETSKGSPAPAPSQPSKPAIPVKGEEKSEEVGIEEEPKAEQEEEAVRPSTAPEVSTAHPGEGDGNESPAAEESPEKDPEGESKAEEDKAARSRSRRRRRRRREAYAKSAGHGSGGSKGKSVEGV